MTRRGVSLVRLLAACGLLWLAGCATTLPVAQLPPEAREAAIQRQDARERILADAGDWALSGRVALTNNGRGGSGRIDWQQDGDAYKVALSAPITRQSWRIEGDAGAAKLVLNDLGIHRHILEHEDAKRRGRLRP